MGAGRRDQQLGERLAPLGGSVVELPLPAGVDVPTVLPRRRSSGALRPLVDTYATVPYRDVDPAWFATIAYVVMFGMMFGDVGDGLLLVVGRCCFAGAGVRGWRGVRRVWPLILALGAMATLFGFLYGEAFGPTGLVPTVWLAPLDEPETLLVAGVGVGAVLLACAYAIGIVNRWREGGPARPSGRRAGSPARRSSLVSLSSWVASPGRPAACGRRPRDRRRRSRAGRGRVAEPGGPRWRGRDAGGRRTFDLTIRLGSNVVSFARLAAFGLMHAAIAWIVWDATKSLWGSGPRGGRAPIAVFAVGHVAAFALEALVAGVQALRLEYYELFSRIFVSEGRPFRPWHVPVAREETRC